MSSRRSTSFRDSEKKDSEFCNDRLKSAPDDGKDGYKNQVTSDAERERSSCENNENNLKVNRWIESKDDDSETSSSAKLLYRYSRRVAPAVCSEGNSSPRPQTEPGRSRNLSLADDMKTARNEVTNTAGEPDHEWIMVNKSSSGIITSVDIENKANALVTTPPKYLTQTKENVDKGMSDDTKTLSAKKFVGLWQEVRDNSKGESSQGTRTVNGGEKVSLFSALADKKGTSLGQMGSLATSIMKWRRRRGTAEDNNALGFATLDPEHRRILAEESDRLKTEIPDAMLKTIKEEAYRIMLKMTQAYRSQIGGKHKLTLQSFDCLRDLKEELERS